MALDLLRRLFGQRSTPHETRYRAACAAWSKLEDCGNAVFGQILLSERQPTGYQLAELRVPKGLPIRTFYYHPGTKLIAQTSATDHPDLDVGDIVLVSTDIHPKVENGPNQFLGWISGVIDPSTIESGEWRILPSWDRPFVPRT